MKSPRKSHTHLQFAQANTQPKIAKKYVLPTLTEMLTKFRKMEGMKKVQQLTMYKRNAGLCAKYERLNYKYNLV